MKLGKRIDKLIRRLETTSGRRIARRNARTALKRELRVIWCEVDKQYPPLQKDGSEVVRKKPRGAYCPACKTPLKNFTALGTHMANRHHRKCVALHDGTIAMGPGSSIKCWCGKAFARKILARHLAGIKDLEAHCTLGALGEGGGQ